jgi:acetate kinase
MRGMVLVVNSGSSSLKYQLIEMETEGVLAKGLVERIGTDHGVATHTGPDGESHVLERTVQQHEDAFQLMAAACAKHGPNLATAPPSAVGHRVVQGGDRFVSPTVIDDTVIAAIHELSPLAPLHNPPNLLGISAARDSFPEIPHVAIFDTAFHTTLPMEAHTYAIDVDLARQQRIRRYGFHGTSHKYVSERAAEWLGLPVAETNLIVLHIGNGVSACAIRRGESVETSMGMTPLEGLVMGTRSGDIDPGILFHLHRQLGMTLEHLEDLLNRRSGLLGMAGTGDVRDVLAAAASEDLRSNQALAVYCHRMKSYVGAYFAHLDHVDAIVFTAGVGENAPEIRARALSSLDHMGIQLDPERNVAERSGIRRISSNDSQVAVLVIPTNEELEIARQTWRAVRGQGADAPARQSRARDGDIHDDGQEAESAGNDPRPL